MTNLSELGAEKSPESASRFRPPPDSLEAQLSHKLQVRVLSFLRHPSSHYITPNVGEVQCLWGFPQILMIHCGSCPIGA